MITVFKYKQKILQKIVILVLMLAQPLLFNTMDDYKSPTYCIILFILELISFGYQASKRLIVSESGIEMKLLWKMSWEYAKWEEMEEAYVITSGTKSNQSSLQSLPNLNSFTGWLDGVNTGTTIKIIITNREALYIKLQDIKKSDEFYQILKEKLRFVKR
jgi:hypothetical protein